MIIFEIYLEFDLATKNFLNFLFFQIYQFY